MADNVGMFNRLFGITSALLELFLLRYSLSFPTSGISLKTFEMKLIERGHDLQALAKLGRREFYETVLPYAIEVATDLKRFHSRKSSLESA